MRLLGLLQLFARLVHLVAQLLKGRLLLGQLFLLGRQFTLRRVELFGRTMMLGLLGRQSFPIVFQLSLQRSELLLLRSEFLLLRSEFLLLRSELFDGALMFSFPSLERLQLGTHVVLLSFQLFSVCFQRQFVLSQLVARLFARRTLLVDGSSRFGQLSCFLLQLFDLRGQLLLFRVQLFPQFL